MHEVAADAHLELGEKSPAHRGRGDPRRSFTCRGALENVASVVTIVLEQARKIGVAGAGAGHRSPSEGRRTTDDGRRGLTTGLLIVVRRPPAVVQFVAR